MVQIRGDWGDSEGTAEDFSRGTFNFPKLIFFLAFFLVRCLDEI